MYANSCSSASQSCNNIPEWKKKLLMKKRSLNIDEPCRSDLSFESLKTVRIGNLNVALRSVKSDLASSFESKNEEDLEYGPGIVDRLRERFLNMGAPKQQRVRRYSSLETLPCVRPFKLPHNGLNGKKAQSMETLLPSPNLNAEELPKPDTVKQVKQLFECHLPMQSIVFDFRGQDVKPTLSPSSADDLWDETDIGADLPLHSGIVFTGENVKVGRGAFLETRNKKLSIQFDDRATSTFEYPSENASPSPVDENTSPTVSSFNSLLALGSLANSRLFHSSVPVDFELGISQPNHRLPMNAKTKENAKLDDPPKQEDASAWSSTNTTDILF